MRLLTWWSLILVAIPLSLGMPMPVLGQSVLQEPFQVLCDGQPLDIEKEGGAAPCVMDVDGDGFEDLLVGESYQGGLRIYWNEEGRNGFVTSTFDPFSSLRSEGYVPNIYWFVPHGCDIDRDGLEDIVTPSSKGTICVFRQVRRGLFDSGKLLCDSTGKTIELEWTTGLTSMDWNGDGKIDLLVGRNSRNNQANLVILKNLSGDGSIRFDSPLPIEVGGKPIQMTSSDPSPAAADWNGDGLTDILVGTGDGSVYFYRNEGQKGEPLFQTASLLLPAPKLHEERGGFAKICVFDWNRDGKPDLLVGDRGKAFEKGLSQVEETYKEQLLDERARVMESWGRAFRSYRIMRRKQESTGFEEGLTDIRNQVILQNNRQQTLLEDYRAIKPHRESHGHIWVYLRAKDDR